MFAGAETIDHECRKSGSGKGGACFHDVWCGGKQNCGQCNKETGSRIDPQKAGVRQGVSGNSLHHSAGESEGHSCQPGSQRPGHTHFQHNHSNTRSPGGVHNRFRKGLEATASNAGADGENH